MDRKIYKIIILVLAVLSLNNIILLIRNYSYAYFEKNIKTGVKLKITTLDKMPVKGSPSANTLKEKLGQPGEIIGVTNDNQKATTDNGNIREYRYSGLNVNNYVYFNCKDGLAQNKTNCETWRIIGIFKDEEGEEHIKIVRNEVLKASDFPAKYLINGITYLIGTTFGYDYAFWYQVENGITSNDWVTGGLQYWLNSEHDSSSSLGYLSKINSTSKSMIDNKIKYYLGTVISESSTRHIIDSVNEVYDHERDIASCIDNIGNNQTASGCRVWSGNQATWIGGVALMYPSDYGYSVDSQYWNTSLKSGVFNVTASNTSWLQKEANHSDCEWLLSPSSDNSYGVSSWLPEGFLVSGVAVTYCVRPSLYLKSEVKIVGGTGKSSSPYQLEYTE